MAAQKKKTSRKTSKAKDEPKLETQDTSMGMIVFGYGLMALAVISLFACISVVYSGSDRGVLLWCGTLLNFSFGKLPVLFIEVAVLLWGLFVTYKSVRKKILRVAIGMSAIWLDLSLLLTVPVMNKSNVSEDVLTSRGGVVGKFLTETVIKTFFGDAIVLPTQIVLVLVLVGIVFVCFGLRPRHFVNLFDRIRGIKKSDDGEKLPSEPDEDDTEVLPKEKERRGITMDGDTTIFNIPDAYRTKHKGVLKPFSARKNWMETVDTTGVDTPVDRVVEGTLVEGTFGTVAETPATKPLGEDPEILRLEQELRENGARMSALEIREIRNKIAEIRRAREEINWENERKGNLVVKGAVRGGDDETAVAGPARSEDETVIAEATVVAGTQPTDDATVVAGTMAQNHESTLCADDVMNGENAEQPIESAKDDDDFIPQVVTSDEAEQDPSYVAPNQIGTSSGIPQPDPTVHYDEYRVPSVDEILDAHDPQPADYTVEELNAIGKMLEEKLENFKVKGKVVGCETGPVITRFEVEPGPGVKVSQFSALQDDLAMALKAVSIRILAPIPGKGAVGIEIPNRKMQTIFGRDIFESDAFKPSPDKIMMALGKDISGEPFAMDLAKAPHLMIAGQTGSGKSVCINALMASMLLSKTPDELRMILVDPKAVELKMYENIPHLLAPVITKPEVAIQALQWLCYEMDRRTEVLALAKVRNLNGFNEKFDAGTLPSEVPDADRGHRMAFIVVIIDEMADLMMVAGKEIEKNVSRLAAKARAVGIHLVLATQRPSVKVITGNIKANLPTRISFKVASQVDARTVMDHAGAEKLLGRGDMLYKAVNAPDPIRVHGAFLSDEEAEKLADACSNQNVNYPQLESFEVAEEGGEGEDGEDNGALNEKKDKLLFEVAKWAIECGNGLSTSAVQRHFSVGYSRAGKIVDQLFGLGLCARSTGNSKPRAMLIDMDQLMQLERSGTFR